MNFYRFVHMNVAPICAKLSREDHKIVPHSGNSSKNLTYFSVFNKISDGVLIAVDFQVVCKTIALENCCGRPRRRARAGGNDATSEPRKKGSKFASLCVTGRRGWGWAEKVFAVGIRN
jgi:hypothetical protein